MGIVLMSSNDPLLASVISVFIRSSDANKYPPSADTAYCTYSPTLKPAPVAAQDGPPAVYCQNGPPVALKPYIATG